jgi:hypothetical protein
MKKEFVFRLALALCIFFLVYQFGVKPIFSDKSEKPSNGVRWAEGLSSAGQADYDVIVVGEDPEGLAAAVSAARLGAKTLLLAEGDDLGGVVSRCMLSNLEVPVNSNNRLLNGGILSELYKDLGSQFPAEKYVSAAERLAAGEKSLHVEYGAVFDSAVLEGGRLGGVNVLAAKERKTYRGRFFIDATREGRLLEACKIPYTTGSEDLNLKDSFMPAMLNFEMAGPVATDIKKLLQSGNGEFFKGLSEYPPLDAKVRIDDLKIYYPEDKKIVLQGLEIADVNPMDPRQLAQAYETAVREAENLALYLSEKFVQFKDWKFSRAAEALYLRETRHYTGLYRLTVGDVLENRYFEDTVAMGSYPVQTGKFVSKGIYIAGKPGQYGIPLGCLVPVSIGNLLMVGPKASYSSLAASSAGALGTGIASGEASGVAAVYSLLKRIDPQAITKDREMVRELHDHLIGQRMYLPQQQFENRNSANWSYPAVRQLLALGLIAGGAENNFDFDGDAREKDLAVVLLNGIYRLDSGSYSLALDSRLRPHFTNSALTRDRAAEILGQMYGIKADAASAYGIACEKGYINEEMQLRLKDKKLLTMDDVYYLGAYNIKLFTGKDIKD